MFTNKLLCYQTPHVENLLNSFINKNVIIDSSDTGTGKTYCAIAICLSLNLKPFIICPKAVITVWMNICNYFETDYLGIANYEMIKNCKYFVNNEIKDCPYITKNILKNNKKNHNYFDVNFPNNTLIIIDEAHRCKNMNTDNSKLLKKIKENNNKILLLSATISDKLECFKFFGTLFNFYKNIKDYDKWVIEKINDLQNKEKKDLMNKYPLLFDENYKKSLKNLPECDEKNELKREYKKIANEYMKEFHNIINTYNEINMHFYKKDYNDNKRISMELDIIHKNLFPSNGSRMKIKELGNLFPENNIIASCYYLQNHNKVDILYKELNECLDQLKKKLISASVFLVKLLRLRQKIEILKVPLFIDLAEEAIDSGYSIVIFVNFIETLEQIKTELKEFDPREVRGGQSREERDININNFQTNKNKVIIVMCQAGNVGLSLHDLNGNYPRMSIISPTWSGQDMKQIFGRIHRAGSKSPSLQKIIYVAKTYEENICELIKKKLTNIDAINDGDLIGPQILKEHIVEINNELNKEFVKSKTTSL